MNIRRPQGVLHAFSIKKFFYDKMDLRLFYFDVVYMMEENLFVQGEWSPVKSTWFSVQKKMTHTEST